MRFDMAKISKSATKSRSAATGSYVKPGYAKANPTKTVIARAKPAKPAQAARSAKPAQAAQPAKSKAAAKKK
jgi:hypothetical protein